MALGTCSRSLPPLPVPGWVGCQVYLCTSCTLINLCKSPIPAPPCFCAFAHSPPTPRASPILLLARGSGMDRGHLVFWNQQGVPLKRPSPPPSQSCLVHYLPKVLKGIRDLKVSLTPPIPPSLVPSSHVYTHHLNVSTWPASRE